MQRLRQRCLIDGVCSTASLLGRRSVRARMLTNATCNCFVLRKCANVLHIKRTYQTLAKKLHEEEVAYRKSDTPQSMIIYELQVLFQRTRLSCCCASLPSMSIWALPYGHPACVSSWEQNCFQSMELPIYGALHNASIVHCAVLIAVLFVVRGAHAPLMGVQPNRRRKHGASFARCA